MPDGLADAHHLLERLGLLTPVPVGDTVLYQVHRWTATALEEEADPEALTEAHHRAARYWRWRVDRIPQSRQDDIDQLLEARFHHHAAGEIDEAVEVTEWICDQLDTWGAYGREEQLCREVLTWVPARSQKAAVFQHQLGMVAQKRGSYEDALDWYRQSLAIAEELGNRSGMASSLSQIGVLLTVTGEPDQAVPWNLRSLAIRLEIGVPEVRIDLHWLTRQREALGEERFAEIVREHMDEESAESLFRMLAEFAEGEEEKAP